MLTTLLIVLIILWLLGFNLPNIILFHLNGQPITLWNILMLLIIGWVIGMLPTPFREIGTVLLILWILSLLGILAFAGLANILVIVIIIGLVLFVVKGFF